MNEQSSQLMPDRKTIEELGMADQFEPVPGKFMVINPRKIMPPAIKMLIAVANEIAPLRRAERNRIDRIIYQYELQNVDFAAEHAKILAKTSTLSSQQRRAVLKVLEISQKIVNGKGL